MADPSMIPVQPNQAIPTYGNLPQMPINANTGYMSGVNAADAQNQQNMNLQGQQLDYANAQNLYQQSLLDNPVKAAQRALALGQAQAEDVPYANGTMNQVAQTGAESKLASNISNRTTAQLQNMMGQSQFYQAVTQAMNDPSSSGPADSVAMDGKYQGFKKIGKTLGIPDNMLPDHMTPEVLNEYQKAAQIGVQTTPFIQQALAAKAGYAAKQKIVETQGQAGIAEAALNAQAGWNKAVVGLPADKAAMATLNAKINAGQPLNQDDVGQLIDANRQAIRADPSVATIVGTATSMEKAANVEHAQLVKYANDLKLNPNTASPADIKSAYISQKLNEKVEEKTDAFLNGKEVSFNGITGVYDNGNLHVGKKSVALNIFGIGPQLANQATGGASGNATAVAAKVTANMAKQVGATVPSNQQPTQSTKSPDIQSMVEQSGEKYDPNTYNYAVIGGKLKKQLK
ncbi:MAG: hypothetical protein ACYC9R_06460 [Nitrosotalea sp.]